ncbi:MAG: DUF4157 domain-containing protein [Deltaproteobacteria bacterium]|nr:MAG: DUF4157 domain-containing protein [Deltaproteobacteria bacterium]
MARHEVDGANRVSGPPSTAASRRPGAIQGQEAGPVAAQSAVHAAALAHASYGNGVISASLGGDTVGGLGPMVAGELTFALGGVGGSVEGETASNGVMARAMRDFEAQDFESEDPSLALLQPSGGEKLPENIRARFERALEHDFGHVRIHRDGLAAQQSRALHAHAFTIDHHIWFGSSEWAPGTPQGDRLLAHELTHVIQHDEGRIRPAPSDGLQVSSPSDPLELEAYGTEAGVLGDLREADRELQSEAQLGAPAMRRRNDPSPPDSAEAERAVRASAGGRLPSGVADRMARLLGHDFSNVRVHTDSAADRAAQALNAEAFALGADIFFAEGAYDPGSQRGQELIAHELTHVVQADQGRLPSAPSGELRVSDPSDAAEREAYAVEQALGTGQVDLDHASSSTSTASGGDLTAQPAMRSRAQEEEQGSSAPDQVEFQIAGQTLTVDLTEDGLRQRVEIHEEIVPGLILQTGTIVFDQDWNIVRGMIDAKLTIGEILEDVQVRVGVGNDGRLNATIRNVRIPLPGDLLSGTMNLDITEQGVGGEATFTASQIDVGEGFQATGGQLTVRVAPGGGTTCEGELTGKIADTLDFTLTAAFDESRLVGNLSSELEEPVDLGYDIAITGASLGGELHRERGTTVSGAVNFDLAGWASAELRTTIRLAGTDGVLPEVEQEGEPEVEEQPAEAAGIEGRLAEGESFERGSSDGDQESEGAAGGVALSFPSPGSWGVQGTVTQDRPLVLGEDISVTGAEAVVAVEDGSLKPVQIPTATLNLPDGWTAVLSDGTYDVAESLFSGDVEVTLSEPLDLGEGLEIISVEATGTFVDNELIQITGELEATFEAEGVPALKIEVEDFTYNLEEELISCDGTVTLEEPYEIFDEEGYALSLLTESTLTAEIRDSELEAVRGDLRFKLTEEGEDFISAELDGRLPLNDEEEFDGTLTARLDEERQISESLLLTELEASADIEGENIKIHSGTMVAYLSLEDLPRFRIAFEEFGYDVQSRELDGFATVTLDEDVLLGSEGRFSLYFGAEDTELSGTVEESELTMVEGKIGMMLREEGEDFVSLEVNAEYPLEEEGKLSGTAEATLEDEREIATIGEQKLVLVDGSDLSGEIDEEVVQSVSGELIVSIREGDEEWARAILNGTYELGEEPKGYTGEARFELTEEREVGSVGDYTFVITSEEGERPNATAHFVENDLTQITGDLPFAVNDEEGNALFVGSLNGTYVLSTGMFTGSGSLHTATIIDIDVSSSVKLRIDEESGGTVSVADNALTTVNAQLSASILYDEVPQFSFDGSGEYDIQRNMVTEGEGTAALLTVLKPFGEDAIHVSNLEATARIRNGELVNVTGGADMLLPSLNNSRGRFDGTYSREGSEDRFSGEADIRLVVIPENNGRKAIGDIDFSFDGTGNFNASGELDYSITEAVGGTIDMTMDQELDPEIGGTLKIESELVAAAELFRKELDILPEQAIAFAAGPVPLTFRYGAKAGFGLGMRALTLTSEIGIRGWKPLSEATTVPAFDASATLDWGFDFDAMAAAWMSLEIGVPVLSAGGGVKGEARLDVPITTSAEVNLHGENDQFWGDLGISLGIGGGLTFALKPFLVANVFGARFDHEFDGLEWNIDDIIDFQWGKVYQFGDQQGETDQAPTDQPLGSPTQADTAHTEAPDFGGEQSNAPSRTPGGPDLSGASDLAQDSEAETSGERSEMEERMEQIQTLAEGLAAIGYLVEQIGDLLTWALMGGVAGLVIRLVYKMITREITWERISTAVTNAIEGIRVAYELIEPYLPDWWQTISDLVDRGINIFDEWWNGDQRMHEAVQRGEHRHAGPEMQAQMVDRMLDLWAQESHKISCIQVLESGNASYVIGQVGWGKIRGKMTNMLTSRRVETRFQQFCEQHGYGRWVTKSRMFGGTYQEFEYNR